MAFEIVIDCMPYIYFYLFIIIYVVYILFIYLLLLKKKIDVREILQSLYLKQEKQAVMQEQQAVRQEQHFKELQEIISESKTDRKGFSEASADFCNILLQGLGIKHIITTNVEKSRGERNFFDWCIPRTESKDEAKRTPAARDHLDKLLKIRKINGVHVELAAIPSSNLYPLECVKHDHTKIRATGKTDLVLRKNAPFQFSDNELGMAFAIIELKTDIAPLTTIQLLLELISASMMSTTCHQGIVILGTDLNTKWCIGHFFAYNQIEICSYKCMFVAIDHLKRLIDSSEERGRNIIPLPSVYEADEDAGRGARPSEDPSAPKDDKKDGSRKTDRPMKPSSQKGSHTLTGKKGAHMSNLLDSLEQDLSGCLSENDVQDFDKRALIRCLAAHMNRVTGVGVQVPVWAQ